MTDCPNAEIRDLLPLLAAGRLEPGARAAVEAHVASCEDCLAELRLLGRVRAVTAAAPPVDTARIAAALRGATRPRRAMPGSQGGWRRWRAPAAAAAAVLVALLAWDGRPGVDAGDPPRAAVTADSGRDSGVAASLATIGGASGLTFAGGLADLSEAELEVLASSIAEIDPLPADEPPSMAPAIPFELEGTI